MWRLENISHCLVGNHASSIQVWFGNCYFRVKIVTLCCFKGKPNMCFFCLSGDRRKGLAVSSCCDLIHTIKYIPGLACCLFLRLFLSLFVFFPSCLSLFKDMLKHQCHHITFHQTQPQCNHNRAASAQMDSRLNGVITHSRFAS